MSTVRPVTPAVYTLAEGPIWDATRGRLWWVDIPAGQVLNAELNDGAVSDVQVMAFNEMVGAVALAADDGLLVAAQETLLTVAADGSRAEIARIVPSGSGRRLNDGKVDPAGRFVVGSLPLAGSSKAETLVRLERDGTVTTLDDDLTLSNGLAWSADGKTMFSIDTLTSTIWARDYDPASSDVGERRVFTRLSSPGWPDGMAIDAEDHLWVAVWGAGEIRRFATDGAEVTRIPIPAPHTSSVAFVGETLDALVVTTARAELSDEQLREHPLSGSLFLVDVGVRGAPVPRWAGIETHAKGTSA